MDEKLLKKILDLHKLWLEGNDKGKRADLSDADLNGADLSDADLSDADLRRADLRHADLSDVDLRRADLSDVDLRRADLRRADLRRAVLRRAVLSDADLRRADLSGAVLSGAVLSGAVLSGAVLLPDLYILKFQSHKTLLRAWKYLNDGMSPYQSAEYKVGRVYTEKDFSTDERISCDKGLNVATLQWCLKDGRQTSEFIEVEFYARDIVAVPFATDGKFRVKRFKVLRKISREKAEKTANKFVEPYTKGK